MRGPGLALGLALLLAAGCASGPDAWEPTWAGVGTDFTVQDRLELGRARTDLESGRLVSARQRLVQLAETFPDELDVGVMLQDAELALWASGQAPVPGANPDEALEARYRDLAETRISVANLVLAARAARDPVVSSGYLVRAVELDPGSAWAHYGIAHSHLRRRMQYRWSEARLSLDRALLADPGHLWARRMESWMLSQEGSSDKAAEALERWLVVTEGDPRVSSERRTEARIDLALIWVLSGRIEAAREELRALTGNPVDRSRRLAVLAVAEQEGGDIASALDASRRAYLADGSSLLPLVQEALMHQYWTGDLDAAEAQWEVIVDAAEDSGDLGALLQSFRARVELERMAAEGASGLASGRADP